MEFEEQFPSLYNQGWEVLGRVIPFTRWMNKDCKKMVEKHCLDKAKVKEALEQIKGALCDGGYKAALWEIDKQWRRLI